MRAALLQAPRQVSVVDVPDAAFDSGPDSGLDSGAGGSVLLRMRAVGLCGSDLHTWRGHHPFRKPPVVLGHEGAGEVVASRDPAFGVGDRVAVLPALSCWECGQCEAGRPHLCRRKQVPGGGWPGMLSEYFAAPGRVLVPLADGIGYDEGALIEPLAVAWHCTTGAVTAGDSVAVLGGGPIGSLVAAVSRIRGASTVLASDVKAYNREFLCQQGVPHVVDPAVDELLAVGAELTGDGFDVVVVASGHPSCLAEAMALARPRGRVVLLPMFAGPLSVDLNPAVLKEITLQGSTIYTPADFGQAARLVNERILDVRPYLTGTFSLAETPDVLTSMDAGVDHLKLQIDPTR